MLLFPHLVVIITVLIGNLSKMILVMTKKPIPLVKDKLKEMPIRKNTMFLVDNIMILQKTILFGSVQKLMLKQLVM
ncbi:hypothetical protein C621_0222000 [Bacillus thuringiensis serovar aizawai str. Leapi01]|nr:hypothetical protein C621_0222000 [Bacillus thuringiensis serovar aizawai str. Leapi01]